MTQTLDLKRRNNLPIVTIGRDDDSFMGEPLGLVCQINP